MHLVWTTRDRARLIDARVATFLQRFLSAVARQERARIVAFGVVQTHLHLLVRLHPTTCIPRLLQRLKGGSAVLANREGHAARAELKWAKGYDIESVSPRVVDRVRAYIDAQPQHHPAEAISNWTPTRAPFTNPRDAPPPVALGDS